MAVKITFLFFIVIFSIPIQIVLSDVFSSHWESYPEDGLPPMYQRENYYACIQQNGTFCKVTAVISADDPNSTIATEIKKSEHSPNRFERSKIFRMKCFPKNLKDKSFRDTVRKIVEEDLKEYNVSLVGDPDYTCNETRKLNVYDWISISIVLGIYWLIIKGTMYDIRRRKEPKSHLSKYDKWLRVFSIRENWNKIISENKNPDFQKLKSIQGIRVITMLLVIVSHSTITIFVRVLENPQDVEQIWTYVLNKVSQLTYFEIQTNFLISAFLLTNQIYEIHKKHGYFSLTHCLKLYVNRIFRFLPTVAILIMISNPFVKLLPQGHLIVEDINRMLNNCDNFWWMTLLQLNIFNSYTDMCHPVTWYLSTDTFFYISIIVLLYVQLKFKLDIKKTIGLAFVATTLCFGCIIYSNNFDIMYRMNPDSLRSFVSGIGSAECKLLYKGPFSSWNTCCLGVALGAIYFHTKNKQIRINSVLEKIWLVIFLLPPIISVYLSTYEYKGIDRAIVGSLLKPFYALGYGIGILGMAHGLGGFVKKFLECDFFVKMGNFTYCTYLFHLGMVYSPPLFTQSGLYNFKKNYLIINLIQDIFLSFAIGIITTVQWEYPGLRLQKMLIPQIEKPHEKKKENVGEKVD